ncbi:MAG: hypothetical protein HS100_19080 [Anaerolineales bacterium]|nr:hypothetical protein [Anaerolineales bacterium]
MKHKKQFLVVVSSAIFALLLLLSCSKPVKDAESFVNCQNGKNPTPITKDFQFSGDLLFVKSDDSEILAFNGETHEFNSVFHMPNDELYHVSPLSKDGKTLVIFHQDPAALENLSITFISNRGAIENKNVRVPTLEQSRDKIIAWFPISWVNSNYLQGVLYEKGNSGDELWETWLLNPYELEWKSLSSISNGINQAQHSGFSISPDMTRVLYINNQYHLVLYDLTQSKDIWEYSNYDGINPVMTSPVLADAIWSEDGKMLALPISTGVPENREGILVIDQNGKTLRLMDFGMRQFGLSWSNDKNFISFYGNQRTGLTPASDMQSVIRVMDANSGLSRDLCILSENTEPRGGIIWSPDQQFLVYALQNNNAKRDEFIIQKLNDPQLQIIPFDKDWPNFDFLGWSTEPWDKAGN